ncbi:hypothetical protein POJ06DRAFT_247162 [Lipomyces tetrasporus]|uniref:Centromere protein H C-terminal domain-containing protein n=1 Tax=Lipomyces tetrasporus TaxID=54092 RepID=A0AAD7VWC4_9ASCO|nr:uncharacterized protein POJ06DRAFT_247162 [Lipomyces tetrasporus]KAJ8103300.1 hypothetical protein POJ06DRAFT_247162 [Lipomyces tetrasporus]
MEENERLESIATDILNLCVGRKWGIPRLSDVSSSKSVTIGEASVRELTPKEARIIERYKELNELNRRIFEIDLKVEGNERREYSGLPVAELKHRSETAKQIADIHSTIIYGSVAPISLIRSQLQNGDHNTVVNRDQSVQIILRLSDELSRLKTQLLQLQKENKERHEMNRATTVQIIGITKERRTLQKSVLTNADKKRISAFKESIANTEEKIETLKPVILGIILGSGLDWATHDELRDIVLECSNNDSDDGSSDYEFDFNGREDDPDDLDG